MLLSLGCLSWVCDSTLAAPQFEDTPRRGNSKGGVTYSNSSRDRDSGGSNSRSSPSSSSNSQNRMPTAPSPNVNRTHRDDDRRDRPPPPRDQNPPDLHRQPANPPLPPPRAVIQPEAPIVIRAAALAALADGQIDPTEQQNILQRAALDRTLMEEQSANPMNARDFAWSVPIGMELAVYTASIRTINIDDPSEIAYLKDLAHGLRISPSNCNKIHRRLRLKTLF